MKDLQKILICVFVCIIKGSEHEKIYRDIPGKLTHNFQIKQAKGESLVPIKFEINIQVQPENPKQNFSHHKCSCKMVSKELFQKLILEFLDKYWIPPYLSPKILEKRKMIGLLYDSFDSFEELCVFTSLSIFETGGFVHMSPKDPPPKPYEKWYSRGLLQIYGEKNYKILAKITKNEEFLTNPDILASYDSTATEASLMFWNYLINKRKKIDPDFEMNFDNGFRLLSPKFFDPLHKEEFKALKRLRHDLYEDICELFEQVKDSSKKPKHLLNPEKYSSSSSDYTS